jgi:hypothetical protein
VEDAELISLFGSQLLLSQYRCSRCGSYFEGIRADLREPPTATLEGGQEDGGRAEL